MAEQATLDTPRASLRAVGESVRITLRGRDGVSVDVPLGKLDRWAVAQLRDGLFQRELGATTREGGR